MRKRTMDIRVPGPFVPSIDESTIGDEAVSAAQRLSRTHLWPGPSTSRRCQVAGSCSRAGAWAFLEPVQPSLSLGGRVSTGATVFVSKP